MIRRIREALARWLYPEAFQVKPDTRDELIIELQRINSIYKRKEDLYASKNIFGKLQADSSELLNKLEELGMTLQEDPVIRQHIHVQGIELIEKTTGCLISLISRLSGARKNLNTFQALERIQNVKEEDRREQ